MSFSSKVLYTGDGVTTDFNVPMPYITQTDVNPYINEVLQLATMHYVWSGPSTISFTDAPGLNDAIEIKRWTSPTATLVDFVDGSVLNANDLDTAYLHTYYLSQEYADSFNEVINSMLVRVATAEGIESTDPDQVILELVASMLDSAAASELQARVTDIDDNGEAIITLGDSLQVQINNLSSGQYGTNLYYQDGEPVPGVGGVSDPIPEHSLWVDTNDGDKQYIYISSAWVDFTDQRLFDADTYVNALEAEYGGGAASFINAVATIASDGLVTATDLSFLGVVNAGETAFVLDSAMVMIDSDGGDTVAETFAVVAANAASVVTHASAIDGIEAEYGVTLNVNGYVSGFKLINTGSGSAAFVILADKFAIVDASGDPGESEYVPFEISGGKINLRGDVKIDGDLLVTGTINGTALINGTIGSTQIGANAISTTHISALTIAAGDIAANAITSDKINVANLSAVSADLGAVTAGTIELDGAGWIKGGQSSYNVGTGYFLGYESGYKFSIGNPTGNRMTWDGTLLTIVGNVKVGEYIVDASNQIAAANTERSHSSQSYVKKKEFTVDLDGDVRVTFDYKNLMSSYSNGRINIRLNESSKAAYSWGTVTNYTTQTFDVLNVSEGDKIQIYTEAGQWWSDGPEPGTIYIKNARLLAVVTIPGAAVVDLD